VEIKFFTGPKKEEGCKPKRKVSPRDKKTRKRGAGQQQGAGRKDNHRGQRGIKLQRRACSEKRRTNEQRKIIPDADQKRPLWREDVWGMFFGVQGDWGGGHRLGEHRSNLETVGTGEL